MITTTTEKMLKDINLKNGVIHVIIDALVRWNDFSTQSKLELNPIEMIEDTINSNILFDDFQNYYITNNFRSCGDFLNNFYKANPDISIIVNSILQYIILPINLILDGKADKNYKPLDYYYRILNGSLEVLKRLLD